MWFWTLACTPPDADSGHAETAATETATPSADTDTGAGAANAVLELVDGLQTVVRVRWQQPEAATTSIRFTLPDGSMGETPERATDAGTVERLVIGATYGADERGAPRSPVGGEDHPVAARARRGPRRAGGAGRRAGHGPGGRGPGVRSVLLDPLAGDRAGARDHPADPGGSRGEVRIATDEEGTEVVLALPG